MDRGLGIHVHPLEQILPSPHLAGGGRGAGIRIAIHLLLRQHQSEPSPRRDEARGQRFQTERLSDCSARNKSRTASSLSCLLRLGDSQTLLKHFHTHGDAALLAWALRGETFCLYRAEGKSLMEGARGRWLVSMKGAWRGICKCSVSLVSG